MAASLHLSVHVQHLGVLLDAQVRSHQLQVGVTGVSHTAVDHVLMDSEHAVQNVVRGRPMVQHVQAVR
eukprot:880582-Pyramimonas_sp.AAC.2